MKQRKRSSRSSRSAVSVPRSQQRWWQLLVALVEAFVIIVLIMGITISLYFLYQRLTKEAFFPLRRVVIAEPLRYGSIDAISEAVVSVGDADLLHVDVQEVARHISALPWIDSATVEKHWPDSLYVRVQERYPVVRWGEDYLDKDGVRFSLPRPPHDEVLFPVSGPDGYEAKVLTRYREMEPWLLGQRIPVLAIRLDPRLIWHLTLSDGVEGEIDVILGRHNLNNRLKKLAVVHRRVIKKYQQYIESVDLRYQDGFSVRWKPGVRPKSSDNAQ